VGLVNPGYRPLMPDPSARKAAILSAAEQLAPDRWRVRRQSRFFHEEDLRYLRFLIPKGLRVLEIGCGTGDVLDGLEPSYGLGVDFSPAMIAAARRQHPHLEFRVGDIEDAAFVESLPSPFDVILIVDTIGSLDDCQATLSTLHALCSRATRMVIAYYSHLWNPLLKTAEWIGWRPPHGPESVLSPADIAALAALADFDAIKSETRLLMPFRLLGVGRLINRFVSILPGIRHLSFRHYSVLRSARLVKDELRSASVVVPMRNERGNVEAAIARMPTFGHDLEILFVEGGSTDGTYEEIVRVAQEHADRDIKVLKQQGRGKADAVFTGFDAARGDVLMILDGDLTMPPEQLPKFWEVIASGKGEFVNGSRLVYQMEANAMPFLNLVANRSFSLMFSWLLGQRFTDTLCGTKVLRRNDYVRLKAGRSYFGDFDPFGDFDLIFGAAKLNLRCIEVPVRYRSRTYGTTNISRFSHGALLLRMVMFALLRIKAL
jgi:SAM-dependent methyltransferase